MKAQELRDKPVADLEGQLVELLRSSSICACKKDRDS